MSRCLTDCQDVCSIRSGKFYHVMFQCFSVTYCGVSVVKKHEYYIIIVSSVQSWLWVFSDWHCTLSSACFWTFLLVFALQIGCALGFLIPPEIVINTDDLDVIGQRLSVMFYGGAALTSALFILILICELFLNFGQTWTLTHTHAELIRSLLSSSQMHCSTCH